MPIDPVTGMLLMQGGIAATQAITKGGPRRQYKWNKRAAQDTNAMNRENAIWALEENRKIQNEQRVYDSPENQMARYKAAGLNPNIIYGNGSSAGSAFPIQAPTIAPSRIDAPDASYPDVAGGFVAASQNLAQVELTRAKTVESEQKSEMLGLQRAIAATNPMLEPRVYEAVVNQMEKVAQLKADQAGYEKGFGARQIIDSHGNLQVEMSPRYKQKIDAEIEAMFQRLDLNNKDLAVKNKILESKQFENAIKELQVNWLKDGDVTPEHIRQGIMLLLTKMLGN